MVSFYPGPSQVHSEIPRYVKDAYSLGIMSINHRSADFVTLCKKTTTLLRQKLGIPKSYTVLFTSSATECWEIIAQSLITEKSFHLHNGAFGQKWYEYTRKLYPEVVSLPFDLNEPLNPKKLILNEKEGLLCVTQNETSNGTQVNLNIIKELKTNNPQYIIAVDATSSMAGIKLDFNVADIWFASVQKCFGLPAGLGLMVLSPQAVERSKSLNQNNHYNSLSFMLQMMEKWQTPYTPNVIAIYLLMRVLEHAAEIADVHQTTINRFTAWNKFLHERKNIAPLVSNPGVHSYTVLPVMGKPETITRIKKSALKQGILLGEGYGHFKTNTFRIANFPALKEKDIRQLKSFLEKF